MAVCYIWIAILLMVAQTTATADWEALGCFRDSSTRTLPIHITTVKSRDYKVIFAECSKEAKTRGLAFFGLQNCNECWGSSDPLAGYNRLGCSDKCRIMHGFGSGGGWANYVYRLKKEWSSCYARMCGAGLKYKLLSKNNTRSKCASTHRNITVSKSMVQPCNAATPCPGWEPLGCYKDSKDRTMSVHMKTFRHPKYEDMFEECRKEAESRDFVYFGIQNKGECWGSLDAAKTYDRLGCANNCKVKGGYGTGTDWSNYVYQLKKDWSACSAKVCGDGVQYRYISTRDTRGQCPLSNTKVIKSTTISRPCKAAKPCPVDGGWSDYSSWSVCSKTCGDGTQQRTRTCTKPAPAHGGTDCAGSAVQVQACHVKKCAEKPSCSVDDVTRHVLNALRTDKVEVNNHMVGALFQVVKGMAVAAGTNVRLDKAVMFERIKKALDQKEYLYAQTILGFVLQKGEDCKTKGNETIAEIKEELGTDAFKTFLAVGGDVSLVFAVDTTASMKDEIQQAKDIAKSIAGYERKNKVNYILSPFNDPASGPVTTYSHSQRDQFEAAIDALTANSPSQNKDCEELAFHGIIDGIRKGRPLVGSPLYVFTDAPPKAKGDYTKTNAIGSALDYNVPVNFLFTKPSGFCLVHHKPEKSADFKEIMDTSGGLGLFFTDASSISKIDSLIKADLDGTVVVSSGVSGSSRRRRDLFKRHSGDVSFSVHSSILRVIVKITATSNHQMVTLIDGVGTDLASEASPIEGGRLWVIENPKAGDWKISSSVVTFHHEIKLSAVLNINFDSFFTRKLTSGKIVVIPTPLKGEEATANIQIPEIIRFDKSSLKFSLVDTQGNYIKSIALQENTSTFDLPSQKAFRIRLKGETITGELFQVTSSKEVTPQDAIIRSLLDNKYMSIPRGVKTTIRAAIDYLGSAGITFTVSASPPDSSFEVAVPGANLVVSKDDPGYIAVDVTAGSDSSEFVTIAIRATGGGVELSLSSQVYVIG